MNASARTSPLPADPLVDTTLRAIMEGTATTRGERFFRALVQYLAISLNAEAAFVARFNADRTLVSTLAIWSGGRHRENVEFEVAGTPCERVLGGGIQHFPDHVQELFPTDRGLKFFEARSYLAVPLTDDRGTVVGHLAVIDDKPLIAEDRELSIFHIFAARATAELMRRQSERQLDEVRRREQRLRSERERIEAENAYLREELRARSDFAEIVGESDGVWKVLRSIDMVAPTDSTVLILGETGTGKELVARAIHRNSRRHGGPFIRVNCAALPEALLESELFGHEYGAFTGATQQRMGRFELADGGTILLDEVGELPLAAQSRLLRVLQEHELERVGGSQTIEVDTRVLAATNRNLPEMVEQGAFREDLYYRLNVFPVHVPPLRERRDDIPTLVRFFVEKLRARLARQIDDVPDAVFETLQRYDWPGNIRELENIIERAMILTTGSTLQLPAEDIPARAANADRASGAVRTLAEVERCHIERILEQTHGKIAGSGGAADLLDLNPNTLRSRMQKLGILVERPRRADC